MDDALETLGMSRESACRAYCDDSYTEWDHIRPLIVDKGSTGDISEIYNLVFKEIVGSELWKKYLENRNKLISIIKSCQETSDKIKI